MAPWCCGASAPVFLGLQGVVAVTQRLQVGRIKAPLWRALDGLNVVDQGCWPRITSGEAAHANWMFGNEVIAKRSPVPVVTSRRG